MATQTSTVKRGEKCMVHFVQMPDNSDTWDIFFSENEPGEVPEEKAEQCHLSVEWVSEWKQ